MQPTLDSTGHRVPRTKPTCLLHTYRPHRQRPFALVLHLHQHQSSCNLHLQYFAKNQSTQCCQSLITPGSDHPPVLEPHMVPSFAGVCALAVAAALRRRAPWPALSPPCLRPQIVTWWAPKPPPPPPRPGAPPEPPGFRQARRLPVAKGHIATLLIFPGS
jgi:hypothetical protein